MLPIQNLAYLRLAVSRIGALALKSVRRTAGARFRHAQPDRLLRLEGSPGVGLSRAMESWRDRFAHGDFKVIVDSSCEFLEAQREVPSLYAGQTGRGVGGERPVYFGEEY